MVVYNTMGGRIGSNAVRSRRGERYEMDGDDVAVMVQEQDERDVDGAICNE